MSIAAAQADSFFKEVVSGGRVWSIRDEAGFPAPLNGSGERAMPFWSKESRATSIVKKVESYRDFTIFTLSLDEFTDRWLVGLDKDNLRVGINWSGRRAIGYDMLPSDVVARLEATKARANRSGNP